MPVHGQRQRREPPALCSSPGCATEPGSPASRQPCGDRVGAPSGSGLSRAVTSSCHSDVWAPLPPTENREGKSTSQTSGRGSKEQAPVSVHSWECALVLPAGQTHAGPSPGSPGQGPLLIDPSALLPPGRDLPPDPASPRCPGTPAPKSCLRRRGRTGPASPHCPGALAPTAACGGGGRTGPRTPF